MPQERKKRRLYDDDPGLLRAYSATSWFIDRLGTPLDWCIPQEKKRVSQPVMLGYPRITSDSALDHQVRGQSASGRRWKPCEHGRVSGQPRSPSPVPWILVDAHQEPLFSKSSKFSSVCSPQEGPWVLTSPRLQSSFFSWCVRVCPSLDSNLWILTYVDLFLATDGSTIVLVNGSLDRAKCWEAFHASWILRKENSWLQAGGLMTDGNCRELNVSTCVNISKVLFSLYTSYVII